MAVRPPEAVVPTFDAYQIRRTSAFLSTVPAIYVDQLQPTEPTDKPHLVLLHGGSHSGTCYLHTPDGRPGWAQFIARCGYPVAVVDWPGTGRSGAVPFTRLTGETICQVLAAFIDRLETPIVLLTHSMSGPHGWRLLETCGAQIAALVAIAPGPPGNIQPVAEIVERDDTTLVVRRGGTVTRIPRSTAWYPDEAFVNVKLIGRSTRFPRAAQPAYAASLQPLPPRLMHERLNINNAQLQIGNTDGFDAKPVLIVTGTSDRDHSRAHDGEIADWLGQNGAAVDYWYLADLGIAGNGHMLMLEDNSDEIAGLIARWIETTLATSRVMCQGERGAYSLCFVFVDEDGEEDAVH